MDETERVRDLYLRAFAMAPPERQTFLESACGDDRALYEEVERLFAREDARRSTGGSLDGSKQPDLRSVEQFFGGRLSVGRFLGSGAFGTVYESHDQRLGRDVAVKLLRSTSAETLYRFKHEFRVLTKIRHPNLVRLYELFVTPEFNCFTMELVRGGDFMHRPRTLGERVHEVDHPTAEAFETVRGLTRQLAEGVRAIHAAGKVHCDLKPANVLVARDGRVVIVDFGIAAELSEPGDVTQTGIVGTPVYMAPEIVHRRGATPGADWYSVGVLIYQALAGRPPFEGDTWSVLKRKASEPPPPLPEAVQLGAPDLAALCLSLLLADPAARAGYNDVLRYLGKQRAAARTPGPGRGVSMPRRPAEQGLRNAFDALGPGRPVFACLHGDPGIGKSTILTRFSREIVDECGAVVLAGRCYERESVPYKALDEAVDGLSHWLKQLQAEAGAALLPRGVDALVRMFPVLERVEWVAAAVKDGSGPADPIDERRRALNAFREMLARIGDRWPLVLVVDDAQWGDPESADVLLSLMRPPDPPTLLLILGYRTQEGSASGFVQRLTGTEAGLSRWHAPRVLPVTPLSAAEARQWARAFVDPATADIVARESAGNPFLLVTLARHASARGGGKASAALSLQQMVKERLVLLRPPARRLVEILAVAGRPLSWQTASAAAGDLLELDQTLQDLQLVAERITPEGPKLESFHDRIREEVVASIPSASLRGIHGRLAAVLEESGNADLETLSAHFAGAGDLGNAARYAEQAADQASRAFAFDHAARLLRQTSDWVDSSSSNCLALREKLGDALSAAGRGQEAAAVYLEVAGREHEAQRRVELERRAAEGLLVSGQVREGLTVIRGVLANVGMSLPASRVGALVSLLWWRLLVVVRGRRLGRPRRGGTASLSLRTDICWSAAKGLSMVDTLVGSAFHARCLWLALRLGDPNRALRALAVEVGQRAAGGSRTDQKIGALLESSRAQAESQGDPYLVALVETMAGSYHWMNGRWLQARECSERAIDLLTTACGSPPWETTTAQIFLAGSLVWTGAYAEHGTRLCALLDRTMERGDLFGEISLRLLGAEHISLLADDRPRDALEATDAALARWGGPQTDLQRFWGIHAHVNTALYEGDWQRAWKLVREQNRNVRRSLLTRVEMLRASWLYLYGRCALAALAGGDSSGGTTAPDLGAKLARIGTPVGSAFAAAIRGELARLLDDRDLAVKELSRADERFSRAGMISHAVATRRVCGSLTGGEAGARQTAEADRWFRAEGVRDPIRFAKAVLL